MLREMTRVIVEKLLSTVFSLFIFFFLSTGVHEQFHYLAARVVGLGQGSVAFGWFSGVYHWPVGVPISPFQDVVVGLAGGFGTGIVFFGLWYLATRQARYTTWELDDTIALQIVIVSQFVYAIFDGFWRNASIFGANLGVIVAFSVAVLVYGRLFLDWLMEEPA